MNKKRDIFLVSETAFLLSTRCSRKPPFKPLPKSFFAQILKTAPALICWLLAFSTVSQTAKTPSLLHFAQL